ncbi:MAG: hypothetical protein L0G63_08640 [Psychrobacter sp.]|uniref:hypothetical protein n=1 Tax=Psychrobacter sp. TaxID=56811 RepID=UPI0026475D9F|nr:hypothetical protein [Psychrobacter sp.]MDN5620527.1 hypothetical protein [Psychrobacter sp.]
MTEQKYKQDCQNGHLSIEKKLILPLIDLKKIDLKNKQCEIRRQFFELVVFAI